MTAPVRKALVVTLVALSLIAAAASLLIGTERLSLAQVWAEWRSGRPLQESPTLTIILKLRLPRTLAAFIAGWGLAIGGCSFQALLRNPLATPYTLGIASAGALGAWTATILVDRFAPTNFLLVLLSVEALAFLFALLDVLLIYLFAVRHRRMAPAVLLLAGVTLGILANAGIMLLSYLASPERLIVMNRWLMGGVDVIDYGPILVLLVGVIPCGLILLAQAGRFDQLGFGEELASARGVNVRRLQAVTFIVGSLMTAVIVSKVGPIGFIGLIVPHTVRTITGSRHRALMPLSGLAGGAFLCVCDILARKILPGETPVGAITAIVGAPCFLYLLMRRRFTEWES
jgi:iron complex transport system permease protein